ncbi:bifunctional folylpolyglutamate synthase/dihydrofolate synthase [Boudabousia marimammalium]|uniref:Dihydrofolate synthase/folylpolyglutamate synthase n=1 Tax=Boudabousia marimammalium TaxID=156892 RepID=A0A1Q5PRE1_9ACTO|nr:folylpolyglutamate synthase/dihydrofolate synthase family protein [Boudabousia marimammalium]OKL50137.1 hypothetical protein BM477_01690 [Boudabousia marimammalium]
MTDTDALEQEYLPQVAQIEKLINTRAPEHRVQPDLKRVRLALELMGNPQQSYPAVHLTGTNGKTSTSRMIDSLLSTLGLRTGRFTSPHLFDVRERISLDGEMISAADFVQAWEDCEPFVQMADEQSQAEGGPRLSFFELYTLMAYQAFASSPVDVAVVEVGMGGRWDATNVIDAATAVITPISYDHERWLGADLETIAETKSGIIKPGATVIVGQQPPEVMKVLHQEAAKQDAILRVWGEDFEVIDRQIGVGGQILSIRTPAAVYEDIVVPLFGEHQAMNAAMALCAAEAFRGGLSLPADVVEAAFGQVQSPGRLEIVKSSPTVLVDAAHNPAGAQALREALQESFGFERIYGVFSAMADKNVEAVLAEMEPVLEEIVVTDMPSSRALDLDSLREIAEDVFGPDRVYAVSGTAEALDKAVELSQDTQSALTANGIVAFGSVVLAGQARHACGLS